VGEHQIRLFGLDQLPELAVTFAIDFGAAVDLTGKYRPGLQNPARALAFRGADCCGFVV
jgi:hypothetical protein